MKTILNYLSILTTLSVITFSCQKEVSFESSNQTTSSGSLQANGTGGCLGSVISGTYKKDTTLTAAHYVDVNVQVDTVGTYTITTDTVNGYSFKATGTFSATGIQLVRLAGSGKPLAPGTNIFTVRYDGTTCDFSITVTGAPGGGGTAVLTFNCATSTANGTYKAGIPLIAANTITLSSNVTTLGTWNITTATVNGMTFSGSGTFTTLGNQTITLNGTGTPTTAGTSNIVVTMGTATCTIPIIVTPAAGGTAVFTLTCAGTLPNGTYQAGTALTPANTITVAVNVTTLGTWNITTAIVNGMTFSGTGSFTTLGNQNITLNGTGTPTAAGTSNIVVTQGASSCTVPITVTALPGVPDYFPRTTFSNWSFEFDDVSSDSLLVKVIADSITITGNSYKTFMATFDAALGFDTLDRFAKSGSDYLRYTNLQTYLGFDVPYYAPFIFIKDNQAVGFTWTTPAFSGTIGGISASVRIKFTILQKDVTITVNGTPYANTIVVEEKYEIDIGAGFQDGTPVYGYYKDYYARNIGWILDEVFDQMGAPAGKMELRRHAIY